MKNMDLLEILNQLPEGNYTPQDRFHDFRQLFMGSDQGKRVFKEILSWGHIFQSSVTGNPVDSNRVLVREGERNISLKLMAAVNLEPPIQPEKQEKK